jgi:hypothetical protein
MVIVGMFLILGMSLFGTSPSLFSLADLFSNRGLWLIGAAVAVTVFMGEV